MLRRNCQTELNASGDLRENHVQYDTEYDVCEVMHWLSRQLFVSNNVTYHQNQMNRGHMLEQLAELIPRDITGESGKAFYSGRSAFSVSAPLYILGLNPGGDPKSHVGETVEQNIEDVLHRHPPNWSAYRDESWRGKPPGSATFQPVIRELAAMLRVDIGHIPASNLVFVRSKRSEDLDNIGKLEQKCWPFHQYVIDHLRPKSIIALGGKVGELMRSRLQADELVEEFIEPNKRCWSSVAHRSGNGMIVFTLTHPSVAKWTTSATDPRNMVCRVLKANRII